jgi:pimeloyl-ACP methyl ester carboxylesterase
MEPRATRSRDGITISYQTRGDAATALVFVHGWLGSGRWWDTQRDALADRYRVVQLDLAGHGASEARVAPSIPAYADDVKAVVNAVGATDVVLIGHSMAGAIVAEASVALPSVRALVLVDTLKNVEETPPRAQIDQMMALYRRDFRTAIEQIAPAWLYGAKTPGAVKERLTREFLAVPGAVAADLVAPLYRYDLRAAAERVTVPVRAINGDLHPTDVAANRRHFRDYDVRILAGLGHYPMLEAPAAFTFSVKRTWSARSSTASATAATPSPSRARPCATPAPSRPAQSLSLAPHPAPGRHCPCAVFADGPHDRALAAPEHRSTPGSLLPSKPGSVFASGEDQDEDLAERTQPRQSPDAFLRGKPLEHPADAVACRSEAREHLLSRDRRVLARRVRDRPVQPSSLAEEHGADLLRTGPGSSSTGAASRPGTVGTSDRAPRRTHR